MLLLRYACFLLLLSMGLPVGAESPPDFHTALMHSTFHITGPGAFGTAFILGKPTSADYQQAFPVLITAAHVLQHMHGDHAILSLRKKEGEIYKTIPFPLRIRKGNTALWTTHPSEDIAVMYVSLPPDADILIISIDRLATDETLQHWGIHPGDRLSCLGYPLGVAANTAGFPVLRSGYIASYPLVPTTLVKSFLFDFPVFPGNSGGPVYLVDYHRALGGGGGNLIGTAEMLIGLLSAQQGVEEERKSPTETRKQPQMLGLGVVIHASLIRETLERLPASPEGNPADTPGAGVGASP